MIDRAFSSRYRWARRGQRQCVFCEFLVQQTWPEDRSGPLDMQSRAAVGRWRGPPLWDHPQPSGRPRFERSPPDDRGVPARPAVDALYTATRRSPRCCAATGSRGGTDPAASPTASPPRPASPPEFLRAADMDIGLAAVHIEQLTGHPADRSRTCCTGTASRSGAPAATPPATAGNTTTHDDPPRTTPSHRFRGSTASGCRRRARTARPRPAAGRRRAPGWRPMRAPAPGGGFPPG